MAGYSEYCGESSGSIDEGNFLTCWQAVNLIKKDPAPRSSLLVTCSSFYVDGMFRPAAMPQVREMRTYAEPFRMQWSRHSF
jgi:hypothetical protein